MFDELVWLSSFVGVLMLNLLWLLTVLLSIPCPCRADAMCL